MKSCDGEAHDVWMDMEVIPFNPDQSCKHEAALWPLLKELAKETKKRPGWTAVCSKMLKGGYENRHVEK